MIRILSKSHNVGMSFAQLSIDLFQLIYAELSKGLQNMAYSNFTALKLKSHFAIWTYQINTVYFTWM